MVNGRRPGQANIDAFAVAYRTTTSINKPVHINERGVAFPCSSRPD